MKNEKEWLILFWLSYFVSSANTWFNWANFCFEKIVRSICQIVFGVQKASLNMFWEYSPSSTNLASDWLRVESSPVDQEERKRKMDDGVARYFTRFGGNIFYFLTCGRCTLVSGTQNDIVVSWIILWRMIKVYWLDFSLHFGSCCLLRFCPEHIRAVACISL